MRKNNCPITKRVFDCLHCKAIKDDEKCPYMVFDEAVEYSLEFIANLKEKGLDRVEKGRS